MLRNVEAAVRVVAVDVGSVPGGNFAWAWAELGTGDVVDSGQEPHEVVDQLIASIDGACRAVLAMESPLSIPVPQAAGSLGRARLGEADRAWSAAAGAGSLATGLAQTTWICGQLAQQRPGTRATSDIDRWDDGDAALLIMEVMVTGAAKTRFSDDSPDANLHVADARTAARQIGRRLSGPDRRRSDVRCARDSTPLNLGVVAALHAGLTVERDELHHDVFVVRCED